MPDQRFSEEPAAEAQVPADERAHHLNGLVEGQASEAMGEAASRAQPTVGADLAALVLRLVLGAFLLVRGTQQVFGWFGGQGSATLASQLELLGYHSVDTAARTVSVIEIVVGALLVLGLFTQWACGATLTISIVASLAQHRLGSGLLSRPGTGLAAEIPGLEIVGGLAVLAVVLALLGAGRLSLDRHRAWTRAPLITAAVALLLGVAAAVLLIQPQLT